MAACSLPYYDEGLTKLISAEKKRDEVNKYLYKVELVANYLPHLNILNEFGRVGKSYNK